MCDDVLNCIILPVRIKNRWCLRMLISSSPCLILPLTLRISRSNVQLGLMLLRILYIYLGLGILTLTRVQLSFLPDHRALAPMKAWQRPWLIYDVNNRILGKLTRQDMGMINKYCAAILTSHWTSYARLIVLCLLLHFHPLHSIPAGVAGGGVKIVKIRVGSESVLHRLRQYLSPLASSNKWSSQWLPHLQAITVDPVDGF